MSYSLLGTDCFRCKKFDSCSDYHNIRGAIDTIHMVGNGKGHLGGGSVTLDCQNFEKKGD